ncbi:MAG TPA: hypothetical protein VHU15_05580 [Stellaceae bacterium]|jgi:hypothetical protein|nr:hypothetical protein [Stellaceae bacterium]
MRLRFGLIAMALLAGACSSGSGGQQLTLHNPVWDRVDVEVVLTHSSDCNNRGPEFIATREIVLRRDKSEAIDVPPDAAVCWRHNRNPNNPKPGDWTGWTRATLYPGQSADSDV